MDKTQDSYDWASAAPGLTLLRAPFPANHISKLPKPSKKQTEELKANFKLGQRCGLCGGWHQPDVVHLDYVGHAALTDRLLDADPAWSWEPLAMGPGGLPVMDNMGGMWIKLTVCGVTRLGYGHAGDKSGGDAIKEVIGDALRNAAMRFGAALDLWHKGDLHADEERKPIQRKIGASGADVKRDAFEALSPDTQNSLRRVCESASKLVAAGDLRTAIAMIVDQQSEHDGPDDVGRVAIANAQWHLLDSSTRSKIKAEQARKPKDEAWQAGAPA